LLLGRLIAFLALLAAPSIAASAQNLPELAGRRVVDEADMLDPQQEQQLTGKLEALDRNTTRQLVVVTIPNLQGHPVEDFAFRLGEKWKIGNAEADNGAILLIARDDKRVRIEVGDGLEGILPDAMAYFIIRDHITPRFKVSDYPGGINAGVDALLEQLQAPLEVAEQRALQATDRRAAARSGGDSGSWVPLVFGGIILFFIVLPAMFGRRGRGRRYRRGGSGLGHVILWSALDAATRGGGRGGGWGGGGFGGGGFGGGGGGFSGGGGSFGGGGASGSW
jgi:uncharacterized protein